MIEKEGNIFDFINHPEVDAICITTNGITNSIGEACMGAGTAGIAAQQWPEIRSILGSKLKESGNIPHLLGFVDGMTGRFLNSKQSFMPGVDCMIFSFPTKYHWKDKSDIELIKQSATKLVEMVDIIHLLEVICIAYPGIGKFTGQLTKEEVKQTISPILDDRFWIVSLEGK